jgi:hypothetical protein
MKRIKLRGIEDNNHYFLLESSEINENEIGDLVKGFIEEGEIVRIIKEGGVLASANQFLVLKRDENLNFVEVLKFDDQSNFIDL